MLLTTDLNSVVKHLANGVQLDLESHIRAELTKRADEIVAKIAHEMAADLVVNLASYNDITRDRIEVSLRIDGVKENINLSDAAGKGEANG